jgi:hypothetical protein
LGKLSKYYFNGQFLAKKKKKSGIILATTSSKIWIFFFLEIHDGTHGTFAIKKEV